MRKHILPICILAILFCGCTGRDAAQSADAGQQACSTVTLTHVTKGHLEQWTCLEATTVYRQKVAVCSPISAYIVESFVQTGAQVQAGQLLYRLESREHRALGSEAADGLVSIKAESAGIVTETAVQPGGYATEGTPLCMIAQTSSMVFEVSVPYEQQGIVRPGTRIIMELPDGRRVPASVEGVLATMDTGSQSELVTARGKVSFLPEGLSVKALIPVQEASTEGLLLPREAIQSDESMEQHWVMCMQGDSTARRIPVTVIATDERMAEVSSAQLSEQNRVILSGAYGLEEGARVSIDQQNSKDE